MKTISNFVDHNRFTIIGPLIASAVWMAAVGCTPITPSPLDGTKQVDAAQLGIEYEHWLAQQKVMEKRFEAAGQDLERQARANETFNETLIALASGSVADWSGLVQLLVGGGLLGVIGDNIRKNGVIGGLKRGTQGPGE